MSKPLLFAVPFAAIVASPAAAQEIWPVAVEGSTCTATRIASATSDALIVRYDPVSREVSLHTAVEQADGDQGTGSLDLWLIFDKGRGEELDIAWGYRQFAYRRGDGRLDLSTRFAGTKNADQVLADLGSSKRLGLVRNDKTVADFDLAGIGPAIAALKACASRTRTS